MKFGLLVTPGAHAPALVKKAEALGFSSAFFVDSPVLFGDPYVSMAAVAVQTRNIGLAVGATNPLTRSAPVTASLVASLNALAPGRIILGIGVGFTATLAMGGRQATLAELEHYIRSVRLLLKGEVVQTHGADGDAFVQFLNPQGPWLNLSDPIPIYVATAGPKGLRLAGRVADAVILGGITDVHVIDACREYIDEGAKSAGRRAEDLELAITPSVYVTDQEPTLEHLQEVLGPKSLSPAMNFSRIAELSPRVPQDLKRDMARVRTAHQSRPDDGEDPKRRHLRTYRGYMTQLNDWQRPLVTPNVLAATSIAGTVEQCGEKISLLQRHGIGHIILSPLPKYLETTMDAYGTHILPQFKQPV